MPPRGVRHRCRRGHRHHTRRIIGGLACRGARFRGRVRALPVGGEQAGLRKHRKELLKRSAGGTIEIGAGTGLNLAHYPDDLDGLVLVNQTPRCVASSPRGWRAVAFGAADRRTGGAAAVPRRIRRHGRLDLRVVHRGRSRSRPAGNREGVEARRSAALHRTRPIGPRSPAGRTALPTHGAASHEVVAATALRRS